MQRKIPFWTKIEKFKLKDMKLPLSLIRSFIDIDISPVRIGEVLTLAGLEVDRIENEVPHFAGVVAADVKSVKKHPDAKNLQVAEVFDGKEALQVVCGAPNCRAGIKVALARIGAMVEDRRMEKGVIRGVESYGMLCSSKELGISDAHEGILELPVGIENGKDLVALLWDPVFEISLTPNLGHCMSALGLARELAAALKLKVKVTERQAEWKPLDRKVKVNDEKLVPRYVALLVEGVEVGASSFAMKQQLEACGQKSINSVVDAANYVMMKFGQPLHAFDADLLEGDLEVGPAKQPFKFLGLDGVERDVPAGAIVISDAKKVVAIAGVMGGANSAVSEKTKRVLFEGACFDAASVRSTARAIGLRTESAQRFEKGVDPLGVVRAVLEAAKLVGGVVRGGIDVNHVKAESKSIAYRYERINRLLGTKLSHTEVEEIFVRLGFKPKGKEVEVPLYRFDVNEEIDLVEEVARVYGYNNIEKSIPLCSTSQIPNDPVFVFENEMRRKFVGLGLAEFLNCDLIGPKLADVARMITPASMGFLEAKYSKSEEYSILRTSLLPGLLQSVKTNIDRKNESIAAFEIGRIHFKQGQDVVEIPMGAIILSGKTDPTNWSRKSTEYDYFDLKGMIENLVDGTFIPSKLLSLHPGRQAELHVGELVVGSLGEVHPELLEKFGIDQRVYYAELNLLSLKSLHKSHSKMVPLSQFPSSERDWTLPMDAKVPIDGVFKAINEFKSLLLESVDLIDLYVPMENQKNATFRFTYRDPLKTISFEEVEQEHAKMMGHVAKLLAK